MGRPMHKYDTMTEPELAAHFRSLAEATKKALPPDTGFIILAAPIGSNGVAQYVSNVHQPDAACWMLETVSRWITKDEVIRR